LPHRMTGSGPQYNGDVAATVQDHPSSALELAGVTGTNGKTTITYLMESILAAGGHTTGVVGTVSTRIAGETVAGARTTPEAPDLQRLLRRMVTSGVTAAAMEVSSHGLALGRVNGTRFSVVVFTNLTQDHLDFHPDLEDYYQAKASLFTSRFAPAAVVNVDDAFGRRVAGETALQVVRVGSRPDADVTARDVVSAPGGSTFTAVLGGRSVPVRTALPGHFNVTNALCAVAAADVMGIAPEIAAAGVAALSGVPGRMERVEAGQPFTVLVDYAHTPDSLQNVLRAARGLIDARPGAGTATGTARVIVVIGCGGDRDRGKRPLMGRAAVEGADLAVLTSDNPRSEDPMAILEAMLAGVREVPGARHTLEPARREAIALALGEARPGDVVVIAGKGHETTQELADRVVDFDDGAVARELLAGRAGQR
ncbi:MAG: UDP-N-acetylmuramoyl-L-alanyl-D-glutamate--2,6-diaminopimelate ligase, partial [Egibacteraceae bacterium]